MIEMTLGLLVAVSVYLLLDQDLRRKVFGIVLLSTTINLLLLFSGGLRYSMPAFAGATPASMLSNPLPQALILTAIVIGFGLLLFLCVLLKLMKKT